MAVLYNSHRRVQCQLLVGYRMTGTKQAPLLGNLQLGRNSRNTDGFQGSELHSSEREFYETDSCGVDSLWGYLKSILTPEAYLGVRQVGWEQSVLPETHTQQTRTTKELVSLETSCPIRNGTRFFKCLGIKSHRSFKKKTASQIPFLEIQTRRSGLRNHNFKVFQIIVIHTWSLCENQISNQIEIRLRCVQSLTFHLFLYK